MQPADVLYNMAQSALKKNEQTFQAFQKSMAERKAKQDALHAEAATKNAREPSAEELKAQARARKAEAVWQGASVFGHVEREELVAEGPVTRVVREDPDTRSFRHARDDDE
ncbi:hypothetical protein [Segniliparus rugosus]|uniref:Uncharacterized protein n=1 Tax=Segniliparus rugosus (strain ATCC BAA-974 / DSM 45345 / CCUG 50838 / CIP 108380 / JCM 13579 / CDC 945) TaxID=679197 RepID=E5XQ41_SEGRC|nr:hypothetical protein [Segniliparus rugosus]EFV13531.1 hypothetical protein HMPREF9336_01613 [Segniliparus rugosus ATCC BAA-974]